MNQVLSMNIFNVMQLHQQSFLCLWNTVPTFIQWHQLIVQFQSNVVGILSYILLIMFKPYHFQNFTFILNIVFLVKHVKVLQHYLLSNRIQTPFTGMTVKKPFEVMTVSAWQWSHYHTAAASQPLASCLSNSVFNFIVTMIWQQKQENNG